MRILWLSHLVPYPPKAGVLQRCFFLLKELARNHEIDLMAFVQEELLCTFYKNLDEAIPDTKNKLGEFINEIEYFDIASEKTALGKPGLALKSLFSSRGYTMEWLRSSEFKKNLERKLNDKQYDLVHFDTISLAVYRDLVKNIPVVLDHHNIESHMMLRRATKENNVLKKIYFRQEGLKLAAQEKKYCKQFDLNITCSDMDTIRLQENVGKLECQSIPNGVDTDYFKPLGGQRRENSLIFIGTMNWYPNVEAVSFLIDKLWPKLKNLHPDASLDIIGSSPPPAISQHNGKNGIIIHGFVDDIRPLFDSSHLYICPITDGGGTKLKILDALAMGKAIVAHPVACEGINVINGESVMFCETESEFVAAIDRLLRDDDLVKKLGRNARELAVREYTFARIGERLSKSLKDIVEAKSRQLAAV